ncbi:alpha/beta hydrolase family protein [Brachybacterium aquaticum]|uniref:Pimeloyl-ACP methyl ester carboxylesterase n=1 Tax=Brachybacterium aquaticum TaxID=1432564 RepID=A0A841AEG2_9MICO|nr:alpha/beta hydrolase [Brachybacterium aquaticum]MBB5831672.1 pimeloyl-ACP methyl ester carboxylesterase [Brachybacterium aquaticum]
MTRPVSPAPASTPSKRASVFWPQRPDQARWIQVAGYGVAGAATMFALSGGLLTAGARVMARLPLVPRESLRGRPDVTLRAVHPDRVHLDANATTRRDGLLALRQSGGTVHVRLGPVDGTPTPTTVSRPLLAQDTAEPLEVARAASNGFYWAGTPQTAHGLATEEVQVDSPVGQMPAWLVRPDTAAGSLPGEADTWAILVHGHGSARGEALRVIPLLHRLGLTSLAITYRNDSGAPASADRMHHLGAEEWEDAEAAIEYALAHGAKRLLLVGWSMGGGIVLRTSVRSAHRDKIAALVLDSPAVDWQDILIYHATALKAPPPMRRLALWMMTSQFGARTVRLHEPLALDEMTPAYYGEHLRHRTLLFHAMDDATVPPAPSRHLAGLRPDLIEFQPFEGASHTREWNRDPARYERLLVDYLVDALDLDVDPASIEVPVRDPGAAPLEGSIGLRL